MSDEMETGGTVPAPKKDTTLEELQAAYAAFEASDAPEFLKDQVLMDLADRIREYGKEAKPLEPISYGRSFIGAPIETVAKSDFKGRLPDGDGNMVKAKR